MEPRVKPFVKEGQKKPSLMLFKVFAWLLYGTVDGIERVGGYTRVVSPCRLAVELGSRHNEVRSYITQLAELGMVDIRARKTGFWLVTLNIPGE